jgi:phosphoribosylamine--glycine ligase
VKVLLLGGGGREHALAWKLAQSPLLTKLWAAPGSDAMEGLAERVALDPLDPAAVSAFITRLGVDLLFVGPEAPLAAGVCDAVRARGVAVFGPSKAASRLETSKAFAKDFMKRHGIPTAASRACSSPAQAKEAARYFGGRCAVKADGLAAGKGVVVCATLAEADAAIDALSATQAGRTLVIEERIEGPEITVMSLVSGGRCAVLPLSRDHKRLRDGDAGPNTGGMGAVAPVAVDPATWTLISEQILDRTLSGLTRDGIDYRGALYAGVMLTSAGPRLLEYNARFGDPETQAVLPLLDGDLLALALSCANGTLAPGRLPAKAGAALAVTLASPGYPEAPKPGSALDLNGVDQETDVLVFHAGTKRASGGWTASGGRVLTVVGLGADAAAARARAYAAVARLRAPELHYRRDIGAAVPGRITA